jgi:hypothetical protein
MSDFIEQLEWNIKKYQKFNSNPKAFIKNRKLKLYNLPKKIHKNINSEISENDLPIESLLGNIFLIKGSNILEFYSYCDYNYSLYVQVNKKQPLWIGKVSTINIEYKDPENIKFLLEGSELFYKPSTWQYLILQFLQSGFQIYTKISF